MKKLVFIAFIGIFNTAFSQSGCAFQKGGGTLSGASFTTNDYSALNKYDVHFYKLDLNITNNSVSISGHAITQGTVLTPLIDLVLQLHQAFTVDSVSLNNSLVSFTHANDILAIHNSDTLQTGANFSCTVYYHGSAPQPGAGAIGNGFSNNSTHHVTWSLSEPLSAYEWWPCKQILSDKADSSAVWITTDTVNKGGSNGLLKKITPMPNGKVRYEWHSKHPIDYYLISVAVAPYEEYNAYAHPIGSDSVLVQNYIYKDAEPDVKTSIDYTPALIENYSRLYGLYPFADEKYGHCQAEIGGAMEHQTMTSIGVFDFSIVAHELAHQWFGDLVTCGSWADIWLNEGFASYSEYIAYEALMPDQKYSCIANKLSNAMNASGTVYVRDSLTSTSIFDNNSTYEKGAMILHMLRYEFNNDSLFFAALRNYLSTYKYNAAWASDFKTSMAQMLGRNLDYFFDEWYYNPGFPIFSGRWNQEKDRCWLTLSQFPSVGSTVFKTHVDIFLHSLQGDTTIRVWIDSAAQQFYFNTGNRTITSLRIDPDMHLLCHVISIAHDPLMGIPANDGDLKEVVVYPNPATAWMTIEHAQYANAEIMDLAGNKISDFSIGTNSEIIDISHLAHGFYILKISKEGSVSNLKFVKQ